MKIEITIHIHQHADEFVRASLERLLMDMTTLAQSIVDVKTSMVAAEGRITDKITTLTNAIANAGNTSPEVDAALADLQTETSTLGGIVPPAVVDAAKKHVAKK